MSDLFSGVKVVCASGYFNPLHKGHVEYLQKGRVTGSYFDFYPSVWNFVPYPDGSLTWSHMWFIVYLLTFILLLIPLFSILKIKIIMELLHHI